MAHVKGWWIASLLMVATVGVRAQSTTGSEDRQGSGAARLSALSTDARAAFDARMAAWDALPASERARQRGEYANWQALEPATRERLRAAAASLAALPAVQRQALRARFDALNGSTQAGWRLGPDIGSDYERLQPLIAFVSPAELDAVRAVLRQMSPSQRADLAILAQRTPPQARDALRQQLIATTPQTRERWLREALAR